MASLATISKGRKILVTDDNPVVLRALSQTLMSDGYEVATAASGGETILRVNEFPPDLILLDMMFPPDSENFQSTLEDGFIIISWLRGMSRAAQTPIIVISGADPAEYRDRALAKGVVATFQKPVDKNELLAVIHSTFAGANPASGQTAKSYPCW